MASLSLKPVRILTQSDVLAHRKKQMGMFQFNTILVVELLWKHKTLVWCQDRLWVPRFSSLWHDSSCRSLTDILVCIIWQTWKTEQRWYVVYSYCPTKPKQHVWSKLSKGCGIWLERLLCHTIVIWRENKMSIFKNYKAEVKKKRTKNPQTNYNCTPASYA